MPIQQARIDPKRPGDSRDAKSQMIKMHHPITDFIVCKFAISRKC